MKYAFGMLTVVVLTLILLSCMSQFNQSIGLPDDNPIEQVLENVLESVIKEETGTEVDNLDLTPGN